MNSRRLMGSPPQAGDRHVTTPLRENAVGAVTAKLIVEWQSWVITRMPPERSHVSFRQLLRTYSARAFSSYVPQAD